MSLLASKLLELRLLLFHLQIEQPRLQHLHRLRAVLVLRPLVLARHDDAGGDVCDADRRVGDVDVLTAGAARSIRIDPKVLLFDVDVDVVRQLRPDVDGRERRVAARGLIVGEMRTSDAPRPPRAASRRHTA